LLAAATVVLTLYIPILTGQAVDFILAKGLVDFVGIAVILKKMAIVIFLTSSSPVAYECLQLTT